MPYYQRLTQDLEGPTRCGLLREKEVDSAKIDDARRELSQISVHASINLIKPVNLASERNWDVASGGEKVLHSFREDLRNKYSHFNIHHERRLLSGEREERRDGRGKSFQESINQMEKLFLIGVAAFFASLNCQARLGFTLEECVRQYGPLVSDKVYSDDFNSHLYEFRKDGILIEAFTVRGKVSISLTQS
jgi:hypothetical protein